MQEWNPGAKSAGEKASKFYEQDKQKQAKSEEFASREKPRSETRQKTLEAVKQVKITEDENLP